MFQLDLTDEEKSVLAEILESNLGDIRGEIRETDNHEYKAMLKLREAVIRKIIAALKPG
jgi:hypothetical protein